MTPWTADEDVLALLVPSMGARAVATILGRSRGSVIGRSYRLRNGLFAPPRPPKARPPARLCQNCGESELRINQRRYCSIGCRKVGMLPVRRPPTPNGGWNKQNYQDWYQRLPEVTERRRLLDNARAEAREKRCAVRDVLLAWGEKPGDVRADYGA